MECCPRKVKFSPCDPSTEVWIPVAGALSMWRGHCIRVAGALFAYLLFVWKAFCKCKCEVSNVNASFAIFKCRPLILAGVHAWLCAPTSNLPWLTSSSVLTCLLACWLKAWQCIFHCESSASLPRVYNCQHTLYTLHQCTKHTATLPPTSPISALPHKVYHLFSPVTSLVKHLQFTCCPSLQCATCANATCANATCAIATCTNATCANTTCANASVQMQVCNLCSHIISLAFARIPAFPCLMRLIHSSMSALPSMSTAPAPFPSIVVRETRPRQNGWISGIVFFWIVLYTALLM